MAKQTKTNQKKKIKKWLQQQCTDKLKLGLAVKSEDGMEVSLTNDSFAKVVSGC